MRLRIGENVNVLQSHIKKSTENSKDVNATQINELKIFQGRWNQMQDILLSEVAVLSAQNRELNRSSTRSFHTIHLHLAFA
jgi:hypothetical protein